MKTLIKNIKEIVGVSNDSAINIKKGSIFYKKPTIFSEPIAKLENGRLVLIKKCKVKWCKITSGKYTGWIKKNYLWGKIK